MNTVINFSHNILNRFAAGLMMLILLISGGCRHKDLSYPNQKGQRINLIFDWQNAPDANPESMIAYFFYDDNSSDPIRFMFNDITGGPIRLPYGNFNALAINGDINDWAYLRNKEDIENFEINTHEAEYLEVYGISTRNLPTADEVGEEEEYREKVVKCPGMLYADRNDDITLLPSDSEKDYIMYPQEMVCHYIVDVINIKNFEYLKSEQLDATLSGMAEGCIIGKKQTSPTKVTHPVVMQKDATTNSLHSEFLTFGEPSADDQHHILKIYTILDDGNKWIFRSDVTSQVVNSPDQRHVHIIVRGLEFPHTVESPTGLKPDVEEWQTVNVTLQM